MTYTVERTGERGEYLGAAKFSDRKAAMNAAELTFTKGRSTAVVVRDTDGDVIFARYTGSGGSRIR